ncbi:transposase [Variovorax sp. MHTC-1]|uniref:transposase n=1 Tax=Variovorax sp. MHTC-1 TaxID=2495593 RepID=UPI000F871C1E|nr:transposase [Variovorax sp. MHTC-1]RST48702.1 transposase [Variovorax sp. MHTC-1]
MNPSRRLVESYLNGEGSLKSIAKAHDITHTLLMLWVDKCRRGDLTDEIDYVERAREAEAKIAALERKVGQLTMELDVLKKMRQAAGFSSDRVSIISGVHGISIAEGCRAMNLPQHLLQGS